MKEWFKASADWAHHRLDTMDDRLNMLTKGGGAQ